VQGDFRDKMMCRHWLPGSPATSDRWPPCRSSGEVEPDFAASCAGLQGWLPVLSVLYERFCAGCRPAEQRLLHEFFWFWPTVSRARMTRQSKRCVQAASITQKSNGCWMQLIRTTLGLYLQGLTDPVRMPSAHHWLKGNGNWSVQLLFRFTTWQCW